MKAFSPLLFSMALTAASSADTLGTITEESFGEVSGGVPVKIYTLGNTKGVEARISNYGGIVVSLKVPDRAGNAGDIVLGYSQLEDYLNDGQYLGALIGRYGNRIAKGKFELEGKLYNLAVNNGRNGLHGGVQGFDKAVWSAKPLLTESGPSLHLYYVSKDGEEGYPGNLAVTAVYTLTGKNELRLDFTATTDKTTILNLTQHSYFNLKGAGDGDILGHEVTIKADKFTPVDKTLIPTGELRPVEGTPLDFREAHTIGSRINHPDTQLKYGGGYDHNWVINKAPGELAPMAEVYDPVSGRVMEVLSTEPGLQFYSGNFLAGTNIGKTGKPYSCRTGLCMEPQHFPDSPNQPGFPTVVLKPGETYRSTIIYRFSAR